MAVSDRYGQLGRLRAGGDPNNGSSVTYLEGDLHGGQTMKQLNDCFVNVKMIGRSCSGGLSTCPGGALGKNQSLRCTGDLVVDLPVDDNSSLAGSRWRWLLLPVQRRRSGKKPGRWGSLFAPQWLSLWQHLTSTSCTTLQPLGNRVHRTLRSQSYHCQLTSRAPTRFASQTNPQRGSCSPICHPIMELKISAARNRAPQHQVPACPPRRLVGPTSSSGFSPKVTSKRIARYLQYLAGSSRFRIPPSAI